MDGSLTENSYLDHDSIQTFVMRSCRMTQAQRKNYENFYECWCLKTDSGILDFQKIFGNANDVIVEIGFGMGTATAELAEKNPDKNYIGIEVFKAGVGKLLGEIEDRQLSNLRIIEFDAIAVLKNMIPDNSIKAFHIFFPDPWQKKRHHKRRLMRRPRTDLIASKLKKGGFIYMVTDWQEYAEDALQQLRLTPSLFSPYADYAEPQAWRPKTKFEKKGLSANRRISELLFLRS